MSAPSFSEELKCNELDQKLFVSEIDMGVFFHSRVDLFHSRVAYLYQKLHVEQIPDLNKLDLLFSNPDPLCEFKMDYSFFYLILLYEELLRYILCLKVLSIQ